MLCWAGPHSPLGDYHLLSAGFQKSHLFPVSSPLMSWLVFFQPLSSLDLPLVRSASLEFHPLLNAAGFGGHRTRFFSGPGSIRHRGHPWNCATFWLWAWQSRSVFLSFSFVVSTKCEGDHSEENQTMCPGFPHVQGRGLGVGFLIPSFHIHLFYSVVIPFSFQLVEWTSSFVFLIWDGSSTFSPPVP